MPLYEFLCPKHGVQGYLLPMSESGTKAKPCVACGEPAERIVSRPAIKYFKPHRNYAFPGAPEVQTERELRMLQQQHGTVSEDSPEGWDLKTKAENRAAEDAAKADREITHLIKKEMQARGIVDHRPPGAPTSDKVWHDPVASKTRTFEFVDSSHDAI